SSVIPPTGYGRSNRKKNSALADKAFVFESGSAISNKKPQISAFFRSQAALFVIMHLCFGGKKHNSSMQKCGVFRVENGVFGRWISMILSACILRIVASENGNFLSGVMKWTTQTFVKNYLS
ncbi:MAG: hypothetical protein ACO3BO_04905, partial [Anaerohalosphaeraceae bacterium]